MTPDGLRIKRGARARFASGVVGPQAGGSRGGQEAAAEIEAEMEALRREARTNVVVHAPGCPVGPTLGFHRHSSMALRSLMTRPVAAT